MMDESKIFKEGNNTYRPRKRKSHQKSGSMFIQKKSSESRVLSTDRLDGDSTKINEAKLSEKAQTLNIKELKDTLRHPEYFSNLRLIFVYLDKTLTKLQHPIFPVRIPIYNQDMKNTSKIHYEEEHTKQFLQDCSDYFGGKHDLKHIFLMDGTPIFNLDEIPLAAKEVSVSIRPFLRDRRLMGQSQDLSIGLLQSSLRNNRHSNSLMINSLDHHQQSSFFINPHNTSLLKLSMISDLSRDVKTYIKGREGKHLKIISKEVVDQEMERFGSDILKDETFYRDLPEVTTRRISKVFHNNTYLSDYNKGQALNAERLLESYQDESRELEGQDEKRLKMIKNIKKQLNVMQYVHKQHTKSSQDIFKEEDTFNFNVRKRN